MRELRTNLYEIFTDNNNKQRVSFFREPLIHFLWDRFRRENSKEILRYLGELDAPDKKGSCTASRPPIIQQENR